MAMTQPAFLPMAKMPTMVVGLGEAKVLKLHPDLEDALVAYGLGSCIAICLWDPHTQVAGMAHVVLPGADPKGAPTPNSHASAVPALVSLMQAHGAGRIRAAMSPSCRRRPGARARRLGHTPSHWRSERTGRDGSAGRCGRPC